MRYLITLGLLSCLLNGFAQADCHCCYLSGASNAACVNNDDYHCDKNLQSAQPVTGKGHCFLGHKVCCNDADYPNVKCEYQCK